MRIVIVGCGRVGSTLAENLDADGHEVIILDVRTAAFDRLPETFKGAAIRGDGTDEEVLRRAGATWREDASNVSGDFFRNRIRLTVTPAWTKASGRDAMAGAALSSCAVGGAADKRASQCATL